MTTPLFPGPPVLLYDDTCGWCRGWSGWLAARVSQLRLAPLSGITAHALLPDGVPPDTLVLARERKGRVELALRARAVLLALATRGGAWRLALLPASMPGWLIDPPYRVLARRRHRLGDPAPACPLPEASRLLP